MTDDSTAFDIAARNRRLAADMLSRLDAQQWRRPSLCAGWTVREVAAHLVLSARPQRPVRLAVDLARAGGSFDRMADRAARSAARRPTSVLVQQLHEFAPARVNPPGIGAAGPMTDAVVHLRDMSAPLGLDVTADLPSWLAALDFLTSSRATRGFVPRGRVDGLRLVATDADRTWGEGDEVRGATEDLAMAVAGRAGFVERLSGAGVDRLAPTR